MKTQYIILKNDRYNKVKSGEMKVWLTLNDDWAKSLKVGETVCIVNDNPPDKQEACYARVKGFYVYDTLAELYSKVNKNEIGYDGNDKENIELRLSRPRLLRARRRNIWAFRCKNCAYCPNLNKLTFQTHAS